MVVRWADLVPVFFDIYGGTLSRAAAEEGWLLLGLREMALLRQSLLSEPKASSVLGDLCDPFHKGDRRQPCISRKNSRIRRTLTHITMCNHWCRDMDTGKTCTLLKCTCFYHHPIIQNVDGRKECTAGKSSSSTACSTLSSAEKSAALTSIPESRLPARSVIVSINASFLFRPNPP